MRYFRQVSLTVIGLALGLATAQAAENSARPEVIKPLQAAQDLIKQQKFRDALGKLHEAEQVGNLNPYETSLVEQLRGSASAGAGDYETAAKSYEGYLGASHLEGNDQLRVVQAIASYYYQAKDYPKAAQWVGRYLADGGSDPQLRAIQAQAYYLAEDYPDAVKSLHELIKAEEQTDKPVTEQQLQLLANSNLKVNDLDGYRDSLERLVAAYPKPDYWSDLLHRVGGRSGFPDRLQLDLTRLSLATGSVKDGADYVEFAELALQAGLPGEAKSALDKGYAKGLLGSGPEAERQKRLRDLADKKVDEDQKTLASAEKEAASAKDGTGLVNTGLAYLGYGQAAKASALIEQGIAKGGLKHPDDAQLHLGIAYLTAGQKDKASQAFKQVQGSDGTADLAKLWLIYSVHAAS
jgi:hypothetical protein